MGQMPAKPASLPISRAQGFRARPIECRRSRADATPVSDSKDTVRYLAVGHDAELPIKNLGTAAPPVFR